MQLNSMASQAKAVFQNVFYSKEKKTTLAAISLSALAREKDRIEKGLINHINFRRCAVNMMCLRPSTRRKIMRFLLDGKSAPSDRFYLLNKLGDDYDLPKLSKLGLSKVANALICAALGFTDSHQRSEVLHYPFFWLTSQKDVVLKSKDFRAVVIAACANIHDSEVLHSIASLGAYNKEPVSTSKIYKSLAHALECGGIREFSMLAEAYCKVGSNEKLAAISEKVLETERRSDISMLANSLWVKYCLTRCDHVHFRRTENASAC